MTKELANIEFGAIARRNEIQYSVRSDYLRYDDDWPDASHWSVKFRLRGTEFYFPFSQGPAHEDEPDAVDVLHCLFSDAESVAYSSFEEWCDDFGFDTYSKKAERTYIACKSVLADLYDLFGSDYDTMRDALHDM